MKYFVNDNERKGTCYHEFYKGEWDGKTFWKEDSIPIHDEIMYKNRGFVEAIEEVIPTYDPYDITEVSFENWIKIGKIIQQKDENSKEIYKEANEWLEDVFKENDCFTILGI